VGTDDVGTGGLVAVGAGNQLGKNQLLGGPALTLAAGGMAAFL